MEYVSKRLHMISNFIQQIYIHYAAIYLGGILKHLLVYMRLKII